MRNRPISQAQFARRSPWVPGSGWYDNVNGRIGDTCSWNFKQVAGYTVQREWSNQNTKCI